MVVVLVWSFLQGSLNHVTKTFCLFTPGFGAHPPLNPKELLLCYLLCHQNFIQQRTEGWSTCLNI